MYNLSERAFSNKHNVYYVDGITIVSFSDLRIAVDNKKLVEKLDKKTGQRRYLDYDKGKWLIK